AASISGVFAARRQDADRAERIRWPGRPKTCMGFSCDSSFGNPSLREPHPSIKPSHICLSPDITFVGVLHWFNCLLVWYSKSVGKEAHFAQLSALIQEPPVRR